MTKLTFDTLITYFVTQVWIEWLSIKVLLIQPVANQAEVVCVYRGFSTFTALTDRGS